MGNGDLRVAHFIGLHSLQVLPGIALAVRAGVRSGRLVLSDRAQRFVVWLSAVGYVGLVAATLAQAYRGQPVTAPDLLTVLSLAGLVGVPALIAGGIMVRGAGHPSREASTEADPVLTSGDEAGDSVRS